MDPVPFSGQDYEKQKGLGTSDQLPFRLQNKFRKIPLLVIDDQAGILIYFDCLLVYFYCTIKNWIEYKKISVCIYIYTLLIHEYFTIELQEMFDFFNIERKTS